VKQTEFFDVYPTQGEEMFIYLTKLAKRLHAKEKQQLNMAIKALTSMRHSTKHV